MFKEQRPGNRPGRLLLGQPLQNVITELTVQCGGFCCSQNLLPRMETSQTKNPLDQPDGPHPAFFQCSFRPFAQGSADAFATRQQFVDKGFL